MLCLGFVCFLVGDLCLALRLSVFVGLMLCIGFVCFLVGAPMFGIAFVCFCETYVGHWVCLFLGWGTYVWKWLGYLEQAQLINCFWNIW